MAKTAFGAIVSGSQIWRQRHLTEPVPLTWTSAALGGCLAELSGTGMAPLLTAAFSLAVQVQQQNEPVAWITSSADIFFPPDVAKGGIDLGALPVIRLETHQQCLKAAEQIARSGAFGLLVIDLGRWSTLSMSVQSRLAEQAMKHGTLILCLTTKTDQQPSLGSLVSIRGQAQRVRHKHGLFSYEVRVLKDKRREPGWSVQEWCCGPDGMR